MKTSNFHIIAPTRAALYCFGLQQLVELQKGIKTEIIFSDKLMRFIKSKYVLVFDDCMNVPHLKKFFRWEKLIVVYTSGFRLAQNHIRQPALRPHCIWHIEDLNLKSISKLIQLLKINHTVHSSLINIMLQLPVLDLDDYDLKLLKYIANGKHTEEIIPLLNSSKSTIERRKRKLKQLILDEYCTDAGLLSALYRYGYDFFN